MHKNSPGVESRIRWLRLRNWHRVRTNLAVRPEIPMALFGRYEEEFFQVVFEDERDAIMFKLMVQ